VTAVAFARDGRLHVVFAGLDALWTVRRRVDLPLGSVLSARAMALAEALAEKPSWTRRRGSGSCCRWPTRPRPRGSWVSPGANSVA
jgi:hypothetical protein